MEKNKSGCASYFVIVPKSKPTWNNEANSGINNSYFAAIH